MLNQFNMKFINKHFEIRILNLIFASVIIINSEKLRNHSFVNSTKFYIYNKIIIVNYIYMVVYFFVSILAKCTQQHNDKFLYSCRPFIPLSVRIRDVNVRHVHIYRRCEIWNRVIKRTRGIT